MLELTPETIMDAVLDQMATTTTPDPGGHGGRGEASARAQHRSTSKPNIKNSV
jgi:hypothetical protein